MLQTRNLFFILFFVFLLVGCQNNDKVLKANDKQDEAIDTEAVETGTVEIFGSIMTYPFEDAIKEAELIVEVSIEDKNEIDQDHSTNYYAKVEEIYKGKSDLINQTITVNQVGTKTAIMPGNPRLEVGSNYLLFLNDGLDGDPIYHLVGAQTTVYTIADEQIIKNAHTDPTLANVALPFDQMNETAKKKINDSGLYREFQLLDKNKFEALLKETIQKLNQ